MLYCLVGQAYEMYFWWVTNGSVDLVKSAFAAVRQHKSEEYGGMQAVPALQKTAQKLTDQWDRTHLSKEEDGTNSGKVASTHVSWHMYANTHLMIKL